MQLDAEMQRKDESTGQLSFPPVRAPGWYDRLKVVLDFILALTILILAAPALLLAGLLVKLTSRGPVLYRQTRLGKGGKPYTIYKIRSMYHNCEHRSGVRWSTAGDPRVTPVGRFLRRTHIDELPQLWNVLMGQMSLVGPRPERPEFVPQLEQCLPGYRERLRVRPGLTGLAQVQLPPDSDLASVRRKLAHDLHYVEQLSFWLDVRILFTTIFHVLGLPVTVARLFVPGGPAVEQAYGQRAAEQSGEKEGVAEVSAPALQTASVGA
jgi:lipopolysaccharide/colanic/teichoic acid biosynthesis glycosyltransferase